MRINQHLNTWLLCCLLLANSWWCVTAAPSIRERYNLIAFYFLQMQLKARFYHCLVHTPDGSLVTGDSNGTIYVWPPSTNTISNLIKHAHEVSFFQLRDVNGTSPTWVIVPNLVHA